MGVRIVFRPVVRLPTFFTAEESGQFVRDFSVAAMRFWLSILLTAIVAARLLRSTVQLSCPCEISD